MACCNEFKTECLKVVTIDYLKTFIGDNIQDANGNTVHVPSSYSSGYCPTYSELTGGTILPKRTSGATPNGDVDGILVGGSYSGTQLVRQEDLSLGYTRIKSFSISASKTSLSECGDSSTLSFSHKYNRNTKYMNSSCSTATSVVEVSDTSSSEVSYSSSNPSFTISNSTVSVGKNSGSSGEAAARSTNITGKVTFRGSETTSIISITQKALTGSYEYWYADHSEHDKGVTCSSPSTFGCEGGNYSATAYYYQDTWNVYRWKDSCGTYYDSRTENRDYTRNVYHVYDTYSGKFAPFTLNCECNCAGNNGTGWAPVTGGSRIQIGTYTWDSSKCDVSEIPIPTHYEGDDYCSNFVLSNGNIYADVAPNPGQEQRYSVYTFSKGTGSKCDDFFTVVQHGSNDTDVCGTVNTYEKLPKEPSSTETLVARFTGCSSTYGSYCNNSNVSIVFKNGKDIGKDFRFDGTNIYAKAKETNPYSDRTGNYWFILKDNNGRVLCKNIFSLFQAGDSLPGGTRADSISWTGYGSCSWVQECSPDCSISGPSSLTCSGTTQFTIQGE